MLTKTQRPVDSGDKFLDSAEQFGAVDAACLETCRERMTAGVSKLDPSGPNRGKILTRWRLRLNIPVGGQ